MRSIEDMLNDEEVIKDCGEFSNFAQWVKMRYWTNSGQRNTSHISEREIDELLLIVWSNYYVKPK